MHIHLRDLRLGPAERLEDLVDGAAEVLLVDARRPPSAAAVAGPSSLVDGADPAVDFFGGEAVVGGGVAVVRLDRRRRRLQGVRRDGRVLRGRRRGRAADRRDRLVGRAVAVVTRVLELEEFSSLAGHS